MTSGAGRIERGENLLQQFALEDSQGLRRELVAPLCPFQPLLRRHLLDDLLHLAADDIKADLALGLDTLS